MNMVIKYGDNLIKNLILLKSFQLKKYEPLKERIKEAEESLETLNLTEETLDVSCIDYTKEKK